MKKNLLLIVLLLVPLISTISCSKDEDMDKDTSITFSYLVNDTENVTVDALIFEYNSKDERVGNHSIDDCEKGIRKTFIANPVTEKVKVQLNLTSGYVTKGVWVQQVYYLNGGQDNIIELSGNTVTGSKEP